MFNFKQCIEEKWVFGVLCSIGVFGTQDDIPPGFVKIRTRSRLSGMQHRPDGFGLQQPLFGIAVHFVFFGSNTHVIGPVFGIITLHGRELCPIVLFNGLHNLVGTCNFQMRVSIFLVPRTHRIGEIGIEEGIVPHRPCNHINIHQMVRFLKRGQSTEQVLVKKIGAWVVSFDNFRNPRRILLAKPWSACCLSLTKTYPIGTRLKKQYF